MKNLKTLIPVIFAAAGLGAAIALSIKKYLDRKNEQKLEGVQKGIKKTVLNSIYDMSYIPPADIVNVRCEMEDANAQNFDYTDTDIANEVLGEPIEPHLDISVAANNSRKLCRIISYEDFCNGEYDDYAKLSWTYCKTDSALVDEAYEYVDCVNGIPVLIPDEFWISEIELMLTGVPSGKMYKKLYIRNDEEQVDIEITIENKSYEEVVTHIYDTD